MQILDGKKAAQAIKDDLKISVAQRAIEGKKVPHLAAILVGNNGASETYVAAKVNDKRPRLEELDARVQAELEQRNELDRELYRFGEELFARQLSRIDLAMEIQAFRSRCVDRSLRVRDAARRTAFARWKKLRRTWSRYPFLG